MNNQILFITFLNMCMLVVMAYLITRSHRFRQVILSQNPANPILQKFALGIVMGCFCVLSNQVGFMVEGSIPNSRVIGAMAAGMMGGPISGMTASTIGAIHRYLGEPTRISTPGCVLATILQGVWGSALWYLNKKKINYSKMTLYLSTFAAEVMHMWLIYVTIADKPAALAILDIIAIPMVLINPVGMVLLFLILRDALRQDDQAAALMVARSFEISSRCIPYLRVNSSAQEEKEDVEAVLKLILEDGTYVGGAILRQNRFLGRTKEFDHLPMEFPEVPEILLTAQRENRAIHREYPKGATDAFESLFLNYQLIAVCVQMSAEKPDYLLLLIRGTAYTAKLAVAYADALAQFFATQSRLMRAEEREMLLRKAELMTLQSQVNPHFLFNSLNTISYFCREKPEKARELIMALSRYFRNTLQQDDIMTTLEQELNHVRSYLMLEQARFEEKLSVEIQAEPKALSVPVPNLILQPLVANGIKHGAMKALRSAGGTAAVGQLKLRITSQKGGALVEILDNGPGFPPEILERLRQGEKGVTTSPEGNGVGLWNVRRRLLNLWGEEANLTCTREEDWTCVSFFVPDRAAN